MVAEGGEESGLPVLLSVQKYLTNDCEDNQRKDTTSSNPSTTTTAPCFAHRLDPSDISGTSSSTASSTLPVSSGSMDIIDCLAVPPPYSTTMSDVGRLTRTPYRRSESVEHILNCEGLDEEESKACCNEMTCSLCLSSCFEFRRVLTMLTTAGLFSIAAGIILGATRTPESGFLTLSLMFAGLGILLIIVVYVGWRSTPPDHEPCHLLCSLGTYSRLQQRYLFRNTQRRSSRLNWMGGRLFPEFRYRRPPPSYAISMHEHDQSVNHLRERGLIPQTPPPSYKLHCSQRSRTRTAVHSTNARSLPRSNTLPPQYSEGDNTVSIIREQRASVGVENQAFIHQQNDTVNTCQYSNGNTGNTNRSNNNNVDPLLGERVDNSDNVHSCVRLSQSPVAREMLGKPISTIPESIPNSTSDKSVDFYEMLGEVTHL